MPLSTRPFLAFPRAPAAGVKANGEGGQVRRRGLSRVATEGDVPMERIAIDLYVARANALDEALELLLEPGLQLRVAGPVLKQADQRLADARLVQDGRAEQEELDHVLPGREAAP